MVWLLASVMLGQVAFGVVGVLGKVVGRVGDRDQAVGIVVGVNGGLVVLVGGRGAAAAVNRSRSRPRCRRDR